jgi:hypothetical protein
VLLLQADAGQLVVAGAVGSPPEGAVFIFRNILASDVEEQFVKNDPYVINGLVTSWCAANFLSSISIPPQADAARLRFQRLVCDESLCCNSGH